MTDMKIKTATFRLILAGLLLLPVNAAFAQGAAGWSGTITPKLLFFDYSGGAGENRGHFLERYQVRDGLSGDERSGFDLDVDLSLLYSGGPGERFALDRRGDGKYNNRTAGRFDTGKVAFSGHYSRYRSASGSVDYLYSPGLAPGGTDPSYNVPAQGNSGYVARFNDDSRRSLYTSDRTGFGVGMRLKPGLLGDIATVDFGYDGYQRDGNRFAPWLAGGSDFAGPSVQLQRWRGFDQPIDESVGRLSLGFTLSPGGKFQLAYSGTIENFDNRVRTSTMGDFAAFLPPGISVAGTNGTKPLHFVPDSKLSTHGLRLAMSLGKTAIAAGYGTSLLEQDSFTQRQRETNFRTGEISTETAFFNVTSRLSPTTALEAYLTHLSRDNDSTFPASGLISATEDQRLGARIDSLNSLESGVAAVVRPAGGKSTFTAGWKREDTSRDLTFHTGPGITAQRSLYSEDSLSDEVYLRWVAKPRQGMTVRLTPSYLWADKTGLVVEPEKSLNLKTSLSYVTPGGTMVSGYYNFKDEQNTNQDYTNAVAPSGANGASVNQDVAQTLHAAGAALSLTPADGASVSLGLDWMQSDFESFYFSTNRRRFEAPTGGITFLIRDRSQYAIDTLALSVGGEWRVREGLDLSAGLSQSRSQGDVGSGLILRELASTTEGSIDSSLRSLMLGATYQPVKGMGVWARYLFEDYEDDSYDLISGDLQTITVGFAFKL